MPAKSSPAHAGEQAGPTDLRRATPSGEPVNEPRHWYPVLLDLQNRECLVVGGGSIGARKAEGLLAGGARVTLVSKEIGDDVAELTSRANFQLILRAYEPRDLEGKWFVVTALDDPTVTAQIHAEAEAKRVWMNAADDPPNCSVILPAVHRDGDVLVAFSTAGASPAVASWLRDRYREEFAGLPGRVTELVRAVRDRVRMFRSSEGLAWKVLVEQLAEGSPEPVPEGSREPVPEGSPEPVPEGSPLQSRHDSAHLGDELGNASEETITRWLVEHCLPEACPTCSTHCQAIRSP